MADKTTLFKATVKTLKVREKSINNTSADKQVDKSILKKSQKSEFSSASKNLAGLITKLKEYLVEMRKNYLHETSLIGLRAPTISETEWKSIESGAATFMENCQNAIKKLTVQLGGQEVNKQTRENNKAILHLLDKYLIGVCKMYTQHKAISKKRDIDHLRISQLQPDPLSFAEKPFIKKEEVDGDIKSNRKKHQNPHKNRKNSSKFECFDKKPSSDFEKTFLNSDYKPHLEEVSKEQPELSEEERVMLMNENKGLFDSFTTMVDEVKNIEKQVVEISQLQQVFTEKILEQDKDIDRLGDNMVYSAENIKEANDEIRRAIKSNAGSRLFVLFFILVCTFTLLFLDWFNA